MKKNAKHAAAVSLGVMGAGFLATFPIAGAPYGLILQSGFEAGLAGGLADWFAVTALFRHPLGLRIPHTALLPRNRDKVTQALVHAIQTNLLTKESIIEKMQGIPITERVLRLIHDKLDSAEAQELIRGTAIQAVSGVDPEKAVRWLAPIVSRGIKGVDTESMLRGLSKYLLDHRYEELLLDAVLRQANQIVAMEETKQRMGAIAAKALENMQMGGFMGFAVNAFVGFMNEERLGGLIQQFLATTLYEMQTAGHPYRESVLQSIRASLLELPNRPRVREEADRLKERLSSSEMIAGALESMFTRGRTAVMDKLASSEWMERVAIPYLKRTLSKWMDQPERYEGLDRWLQNQAASMVERNHDAIGALVKQNADKLDNDTLIAMMEEHVGKDLQWIRINGALCGFAIGLVLGVIKLWLE